MTSAMTSAPSPLATAGALPATDGVVRRPAFRCSVRDYALPGLTFVSLLAGALFCLSALIVEQKSVWRDLETGAHAMSHLEVDHLKFLHTLDLYFLGDERVGHDDLLAGFAALGDRLSFGSPRHGPEPLASVDGLVEFLLASARTVREIEPAVGALVPGDMLEYRHIRGAVEGFTAPIATFAERVDLQSAWSAGYRKDRIRVLYAALIALVLAATVSGGYLIVLLLRGIRGSGEVLLAASNAEARAATAQTRLVDAIETLEEGFILYDANDRLVLCNARIREMYAETAELLVPGARYEDILREGARRGQYADAVGREDDWVAQRMAQHRTPLGPVEQLLAGGRWLRTSEQRTRDGGTVGLRTDITDAKQREAELRLGKHYLSGIMDNVPEGIITMDEQGRIETLNTAAETLFGYAAADIVGQNVAILMPESEREPHAERIRNYLGGGGSAFLGTGPREVEGQRSDGTVFPLELAVSEIVHGDRRLFIGSLRDVSERKAAAAQLSARAFRQEILAALGENALEIDNIRVIIEESVVVLAETLQVRFCEVLKIGPDGNSAILQAGLGWDDSLTGQEVQQIEAGSLAQYVLDAKGPVAIDDLQGETRFAVPGYLAGHGAASGLIAVIPSHPQPYGFIAAYTHDRHEFTENDAHLIKSVANLLAVAIDRNRADEGKRRMETQLRQAQKMESLGTLAGGIAHDFNNVLVPILGLAKITMKRMPENSRDRSNLEKVLEAGERAKGLVKQILAFSREGQPGREAMDLGSAAVEALDLLKSTLPSTIEIRREIDPETGMVDADRTQMHQVLINLAANAADAMGPKGGVLTVSLREVDVTAGDVGNGLHLEPGRYVKLSVADSGCGMDRKTIDRIFEPFFTTKDVGEGTGLGLSVIHGIVTAHGGVITVDSKPDSGTTFDIYLPPCVRIDSDAIAAAPAAAPAAA